MKFRPDFFDERLSFGMQETWTFKADSSRRPCIICPCSEWIRPLNRMSPIAQKVSEEFNVTAYGDDFSLEFGLSHLPEIPEICIDHLRGISMKGHSYQPTMPKQTITLCSVLACDAVNSFGPWVSSSQDWKPSSEDRSECGDGTVVREPGVALGMRSRAWNV